MGTSIVESDFEKHDSKFWEVLDNGARVLVVYCVSVVLFGSGIDQTMVFKVNKSS